MYVNNTNILLLIYNVYNCDYSFGENKNKRTYYQGCQWQIHYNPYISFVSLSYKPNYYISQSHV